MGESEEFRIVVSGEGSLCRDAKVTITVVLPPTTTVQKINAHAQGLNKDDKLIYTERTLTGQKNLFRQMDGEIEVEGIYSDGVERNIATDPKMVYKSLDEKIATVALQGDKVVVTPKGVGKTDIVVEYGSYQDRLRVVVKEYICQECK
jgi:hypothetical protein